MLLISIQTCKAILLDVGPMADGSFPPEAVERLKFFANDAGKKTRRWLAGSL